MTETSKAAFGHSLLLLTISSMVWTCGLDIFRPVRKYVMGRKYFKKFRRMLKDTDSSSPCCPSCRLPFDKGKKRRLIDTCGHERCYTCIFTTDQCPLCVLKDCSNENEAPLNLENKVSSRITTQRQETSSYLARFGRGKKNTDASNTRGVPNLPSRRSTYFPFPRHLQRQVPVRPNTVSVDNHIELKDLSKQYNCSSNMVKKISSLWTIGEGLNSIPQQEVSRVDLHPPPDHDPTETGRIYEPTSGGRPPGDSLSKKSTLNSSGTDNSTDDSPMSTLSISSRKERHSRYSNLRSREHSVTSLMSISSTSSTTPMESMKLIEIHSRADSKRFSLARCSNFSLDLSAEGSTIEPSKVIQPLTLKPLYFEVPQTESDPPFVGRQWLFREIEKMVNSESPDSRGLVIVGGAGSGKTSVILQLVDYSSFGRKWEDTVYQTTHDIYWRIRDLASRCSDGDQMSTSSGGSLPQDPFCNQSAVQSLAPRVVGYHFCQADYNSTCLVPDFVHSIAAQLCQAPQLLEYRDLLMKEPRYQHILSLESCIADPSSALVKGILEPLDLLTRLGQVPPSPSLLVVDSVHEAEAHRPAHGDTIASFLAKHAHKFPRWLKVVLTVRTAEQELMSPFPFRRVSLDRYSTDENIQRDIQSYIKYRINGSNVIQVNITANRKDEEESTFSRFADHLASISKGCFLYAKLTLDLLQLGHLVVKSSSYNVLPVSLNEVFMLNFNLRFTTSTSFDRVSNILQVCLASLYPLTALEIYHSVNAARRTHPLTWSEFLQQLEVLTMSQVLVPRQDGSLMVSHPSLREWLHRREENENNKFLCDVKAGHAKIALRMTRLDSPLTPDRNLELAFHMLKANIYRSAGKDLPHGISVRDLQASWLHHSIQETSAALACQRNVFSPNAKVSRLLLQAGADPNSRASGKDKEPLLTLVAGLGYTDMVALLLEYGADCNSTTENGGITSLCLACREGHLDVARLLLAAGAKIDQKDNEGRSALGHAAAGGHMEVVNYLLHSDWPANRQIRAQAILEALVVAAGKGHTEMCEYLLSIPDVRANSCDPVTGHTALTSASLAGKTEVCKLLLRKGALASFSSRQGAPPIIWAVQSGHWEVVELLLTHQAALTQTDREGRTPLMWAAAEEKIGIMELLLEKGVSVTAKDKEGLTALSWSCMKNHIRATQCLLDHKAELESTDKLGRTPLGIAAQYANADMVNLLLKHGANMEHVDFSGTRALERALSAGNVAAVSLFLHRGAKLGPKTWTHAEGQPHMILILIHKLLSDGVVLYKKEKLREAAHRFQYALKRFPKVDAQGEKRRQFHQLRFHLHLGLSRCKRKLKEYEAAIDAADAALQMKPQAFEAFYLRARARKEAGNYQEALSDVAEAIRFSGPDPEVKRTLQALRADIATSSKVVSPLDGAEADSPMIIAENRSPESPSPVALRQFPVQPCRTTADCRTIDAAAISRTEEKSGAQSFCTANSMASVCH